jgi:hypothetical protein
MGVAAKEEAAPELVFPVAWVEDGVGEEDLGLGVGSHVNGASELGLLVPLLEEGGPPS